MGGAYKAAITTFVIAALGGNPACAMEDWLRLPGPPGVSGGHLVSAQRTEPKTLNWLVASDAGSREVLQCLMADLIHINRQTQKPEPALAKSWTVSADGLHWVLELRSGLKFSDGHPFDADDVVFTFRAIYDEKVHSPQRDLLMLNGRPIGVRKLDAHRITLDLPGPRAVAERLFDGVYILPRHRLEAAFNAGKLGDAWALNTGPAEVAGLGPFRLKGYAAGQQITLERNPYYWQSDSAGNQLPYLNQVTLTFAGTEDNQVLRFQGGESDLINRVGSRNYAVLDKDRERRGFDLRDLGGGLEYAFLVFNLAPTVAGAPPEIAAHQSFLRRKSLRQAISAAIDRDALVKLVYMGRATPVSSPVPPGNRLWVNPRIAAPVRSLDRARRLLMADGFHWKDGAASSQTLPSQTLLDPSGKPVEFSILVSNNNPERQQMAAMIQDDLKSLGIRVNLTQMEFRSIGERVQRTHEFEAALLALPTPDADPNPDLAVYLSSGGNHLWNPGQKSPSTTWETEIDGLMQRQLITLKYEERKRLFDRVQEIMVEERPLIPLVSPHILVGANKNLANFRPALLEPYTMWNVAQLYWRTPAPGSPRR